MSLCDHVDFSPQNFVATIITCNILPPSLCDCRAPAEAYRCLASLIVFLPSPLTLQRWSPKYPRWKQHLACVRLCAVSLFFFFFCLPHSVLWSRWTWVLSRWDFVLAFHCRWQVCIVFPSAANRGGLRGQYDKRRLSAALRGAHAGADTSLKTCHICRYLVCLHSNALAETEKKNKKE